MFIFFLIICQQVFSQDKATHDYERHIGVLVRPDFLGERSLACRIKAACENLHWKVEIVDIRQCKDLRNKTYDFVISLVPGSYKRPKCKNYLAIFHPLHHYFETDGSLKRKYNHYNGYLLTYSPRESNLRFKKRKIPYFKWYPTAQKQKYKKVDPLNLFHLCCSWGNRFEDQKFQKFFHLLDHKPYTRFYGAKRFQNLYPQSYRSTIPYDDTSLYETASAAGITLVLHSLEHNASGLPSGRIFEAAAASTVIISDENAFVKDHFGDSVLYVNTDEPAESICDQIESHMNWIQANKTAALEMAKKAHKIYKQNFLLEDQLVRLGRFHDNLAKGIFRNSVDQLKAFCSTWMKKIRASLFITAPLHALVHPIPSAVLPNITHQHSLINSVDFHPKKNFFCATYTHNNKILLYQLGKNHQPILLQSLQNPLAKLSEPQHAVFSPDGERLVVANWTNQTLTVYQSKQNGLFNERPIAIIPSPKNLEHCKPHGIAFSPCGKWLAIAYGASSDYERAIALFETTTFNCISALKNGALPGIPKGITFSPDGTCLLVTFSDRNSLKIFNIEDETISSNPIQIIKGMDTGISRPEDVKISHDGRYCAVTNSDQNTVTFYPFDPESNSLLENSPCFTLRNPEGELCFPHGIAFSPDGTCIAVTQFGPVHTTEAGDVFSGAGLQPGREKVNLYRMKELISH